jgi:hypothetical protein
LSRALEDASNDHCHENHKRADRTTRRGAGKQADQALVRALEINPFVPQYLLGAKQPRSLPQYVGIGDQSEAIDYVAGAYQL